MKLAFDIVRRLPRAQGDFLRTMLMRHPDLIETFEAHVVAKRQALRMGNHLALEKIAREEKVFVDQLLAKL